MVERLRHSRTEQHHGASGFTVIEGLVVIVVLAVLAAVAVYVVVGDDGNGTTTAADDARPFRAAQQAYCEQTGRYATEQELVDAGLLDNASSHYDAAFTASGECAGAGDLSKSGYVLGYAEPNGGKGSFVESVKIAAGNAGNGVTGPATAQPVAMYKGPGFVVNSYMFDTLLWKGATGETIPWLSTNVPAMETAPGPAYTYTFALRGGANAARWHDGGAVTAQNVADTFTYFKTGPGSVNQGLWKPFLKDVTGVTASGDSVTFTLSKPSQSFIPFVAMTMPVLPMHIWNDTTKIPTPKVNNGWAFVGSGPYRIPGVWNADGSPNAEAMNAFKWPGTGEISLEGHMGYFLGAPFVRKLQMVNLGSTSGLTALAAGQVDAASPGTAEALTDAALASVASYPSVTSPGSSVRSIHFNLQKGFPYDNTTFRQAVATALNRDKVVADYLGGHGVVGNYGGLAPTHPMVNKDLPSYAYDKAAAAAMLDSINIRFDPKKVTKPDYREVCSDAACTTSTDFRTTLFSTNQGSDIPVDLVVADLAAAGLNIERHTESQGNATPAAPATQSCALDEPNAAVPDCNPEYRAITGQYQMAILSYANLNSDPDWLRVRYAGSGTGPVSPENRQANFFNIIGWAGANYDRFVAEAAKQQTDADLAGRTATVRSMQALIAADVLTIPVYHPDDFTFYRGDFRAWYYTPGSLAVGPNSVMNKAALVTAKMF